ncbi:hypothetical protein [uncultured Chryseobacterium sp.]|uniref:hypothetical protein n=1 Tax=uncultured Chryseobacterium sp. TaxID=259322 RepID=UPI0025D9D478|nr:hypothetical protein [uncultured Chryseobacterium sp.]
MKKRSVIRQEKRKATIALYLANINGISLVMSKPESNSHHDTYDISTHFMEVISVLKALEIHVDGLFMNADSDFDCHYLRTLCSHYGIISL